MSGMSPLWIVAETIGDYCLGREQDRIESFETCMRREQESSDHTSGVITLLIIGIIVAVILVNRANAKKAEAEALRKEQLRQQSLSPAQRLAEQEAARVQREQSRRASEDLEVRRKLWQSGFFIPGVPLPPSRVFGSRPKPPGHAPPGWYDAPPGDGSGLYYYRNYPHQYWNGIRWLEETAPPAQFTFWQHGGQGR
jgi:hypothetical protein